MNDPENVIRAACARFGRGDLPGLPARTPGAAR
jgi:hypothetical protein